MHTWNVNEILSGKMWIISVLFCFPLLFMSTLDWFLAAEYVLSEWTHLSCVLLSVETSPKHTAPGAL